MLTDSVCVCVERARDRQPDRQRERKKELAELKKLWTDADEILRVENTCNKKK